MNTVGDRLRRLRVARALSMRAVSIALDVREMTVSDWERDVKHPGATNLMKLARFYKVAAERILEGKR